MTQLTEENRSVIGDIVKRSAARSPKDTAIVFQDRTWTYSQLDQAVTNIARFFVEHGLEKGDRVAAYSKNSDIFAIVFLACARAGLIHVPVNYQLTKDELDYILSDSDPKLILAEEALMPFIEETEAGQKRERMLMESLVEPALKVDGPARDGEFSPVDTDRVQLLYTSGTTSSPKGAVMTHRSLMHQYLSVLTSLDITSSDRFVHALPLYHSAQMHVLLIPALIRGAYSIIVPTPVPQQLLELIEKERITAFFAAPTVWVALTNNPDFTTRDLSSLKKAYYGASIMPGPIIERLQKQLPELGLYNCFGQSEMGPLCTVLRPEEHADRPASAGRPALFVETRIVDLDGNDVEVGQRGEILYRSPQLAEGYWNKPEKTAEAFVGGWFHSGDLVVADEEGYITVVDRVKDVINTGGVLVASREVEDAIFSMDGVEEVSVVGMPDEKWIEAITAYVVLTDAGRESLTEEAVIEYVKGKLAGFKVPKAVHFVDALPKNSAGKILKRSLREGAHS
ncbi:Long-chain-fatty-acid--CoA ligase [Brevibacterium ravenspurgense]|uniref:Long-chain-fatty-acid--CoA ligase n=1 Tax=Brevibacterium ravenspurgense TaxID=479117 RepID=A0A150H842_9MICO|nr:fatty acyl-CoA synthetase [Brevibacterium ravenspurgense]KXZ58269.1 Long-chain-fatty-acid--CoA ligase [Brevibacterium ravenspurgense]